MGQFRRMLALAVCLCVFPLSALATEAGTANGNAAEKWAKGTVRASETVHLYAPVSGQVEGFDMEVNDDVEAGGILLTIRPQEILAPYDGVVRVQHARVGDLAQNVLQSYGGLCYLEREEVQWLRTTTETAYNDSENRDIRVGETLRIFNGKTYNRDKRESQGRVVAVDGNAFVVEFPSGTFDVEEEIRVYRGTGDEYKDADMVGRGNVMRVPPIAIMGEGVVAGVLAQEGETVSRGDTLYVLDSASVKHEAPAQTDVASGTDGVLTALHVQGGQQVTKGQLLMTITPLDKLECVVEVDELDILSLPVGQIVQVKLDAQPGTMQAATVERIAPIGKEVLDTTKYEVTLSFATVVPGLMPGMHATAYWN